jgi:NAD(P)-dependent dehydrogenase (short-subunit alcohol dehydrogenase family)
MPKTDDIDHQDRKVALVTGGRRGIGRGIAWALAGAGFDIVIVDLERDAAAEETLAGVADRGSRAKFVRGDIGAVEGHRELVDAAWSAFGHPTSVYEVRPGFVHTDTTADATEDKDMRIARGDVPIPRWGEAEDVGRAVAVLASGAIPYATGSVLFVDGGFNVKRL